MGAVNLTNIFKVIQVAEQITKSPLFGLIKERLPDFGLKLTNEQRASLDANYAKYVKAIEESEAASHTGRVDPQEGDTD